jgi:hypothetical protein
MSEDFLSRWSRRKREARRTDEAEPGAARDPLDARGEALTATEQPSAAAVDPAEITAEELAQLPRPEDLTVDSDLAAFLRKGVPEALRNAALRRMWSLDPAIRDFVGHARDYAYDWNTPGGVPGFAPLSSAEVTEAMVERLKSLSPAASEEAASTFDQEAAASHERDASRREPPDQPRSISGADAAPQTPAAQDRASSVAEESSCDGGEAGDEQAGGGPASAAPQREPHVGTLEAAMARRHGTAKPV